MKPYTATQSQLFELGKHITEEFLEAHNLRIPKYTNRSLNSPHPPSGSYGCGHYVWRIPENVGTVWVHADVCAKPAHGTPRQYSFPGNLTDRTPVGVVAHEIGHHVDHVLHNASHNLGWMHAIKGPKVSSYEPYPNEAFAESMRVFVLNPALLKAACPERYAYITNVLGLRPTRMHKSPLKVLQDWGAAEAILRAAANRAKMQFQ